MNTINPTKSVHASTVEPVVRSHSTPSQPKKIKQKQPEPQFQNPIKNSASLSSVLKEATDGDASESLFAGKSPGRTKGNASDGPDQADVKSMAPPMPGTVLDDGENASDDKDRSKSFDARAVSETAVVNVSSTASRGADSVNANAISQDDWMLTTATMQPAEVASDAASRVFQKLTNTLANRSFIAKPDAAERLIAGQLNSVSRAR
ncbi:hypothetical protein [uncultured Tateyamaria sp.]|uniref:hypothetical protein n=1 Tax=uncultured Tateyamaria sp. TaxID=455651 RepID=UPI002637FF80|nr:hypothetical protein [uncultured Tateyamaria sp.]